MKREGRQHGMVRSFRILPEPLNPRPESRFVNKFDSPPTAGLFTKVSSKPTNHSKFTGKCGSPRCSSCHLHPACKSKDKVKGTHKHNSSDAASNYRLVTFRVVDERPGLHAFGLSATGLVDHIYNDNYYSEDEGYEFYEGGNEDNCSFGELLGEHVHDHEVEVTTVPWNAYGDDDENGNWRCGDDANVCISEKGFEIDRAEEDEGGWCLVESSS
ncbi:hypothetical protein L6164_005023 [Bauhinia variegata]|uniref:Uncharacterized protein n=1 Tax=Bauhinia variegata TaxID=167791 RepID=A0ACB9PPZ6_BAUVA|nr:hypothetical protein L6164_005023 [Bauhinia variegata]